MTPRDIASKGLFIVVIVSMIVFRPMSVAAQPLFDTDHDWTIDVGNATFGLRQTSQRFTQDHKEFAHTRIFLGWYDFHVRVRAPHIVTGVIMIVFLTVGLEWLRCMRWHSTKV